MVNALWETDAAPTSAKKIVSNVCSAIRETMRQHFPEMDLIVYENSEYRISSYYNVRTDYQEVQDLYAAANVESDKQKKADLLYQALTSHPGRLLPSQVDTPGVMPVIADYTYERKDKIKECMKLLYEVADYRRMLLLEEEVFVFYYDDPELIVWVIRAYIGLNHLGTAREFLQSWHKKLPKETYWELEREIKEANKQSFKIIYGLCNVVLQQRCRGFYHVSVHQPNAYLHIVPEIILKSYPKSYSKSYPKPYRKCH